MENGGKSLKQHLVRLDLTGCFYPDCFLCESGSVGGSHTRSGAHYSGTCVLCEEQCKSSRLMERLVEMDITGVQKDIKKIFWIKIVKMHSQNTWNYSIQTGSEIQLPLN